MEEALPGLTSVRNPTFEVQWRGLRFLDFEWTPSDPTWDKFVQLCTMSRYSAQALKYSELNHKNESYFFLKKNTVPQLCPRETLAVPMGPFHDGKSRSTETCRGVPRCAEMCRVPESRPVQIERMRYRGYGGYGEWTTEIGEHKKNTQENADPKR